MAPRKRAEATRFLLRLPPALYAELQAHAEASDRSVNAQIVAILRAWVARRRKRA